MSAPANLNHAQQLRMKAARCAASILRTKAGKYAERMPTSAEIEALARYIIGDDEAHITANVPPLLELARAIRRAQRLGQVR